MAYDLKKIQDYFKYSYEAFKGSRDEADSVWNMYHNRQYTQDEIAQLQNQGRPVETFNVIKLFSRLITGYYNTVINTVTVLPREFSDAESAAVMNDVIQYILEDSLFETEGNKVKLDGLISGLMCVHLDVEKLDKTDNFGRPFYDIKISHVPSSEIILDPLSRLDDYSDARFIHRFKWVSKESVQKLYGKEKLKKLDANRNHVEVEGFDAIDLFNVDFVGKYEKYDLYLVVHSICEDEETGKIWSTHWCQDTILDQKEVTYSNVRFPYRIQKLYPSNHTEYYGVFRDVYETQRTINQALLKLQLMAATEKVLVDVNAIDDLGEFGNQVNRVNSIIPVKDINGVMFVSTNKDVIEQYQLIEQGLNRIKQVLGVNDSFLGQAYASDSGRKVKLQQNATELALNHITSQVKQLYRLLGKDIIGLVRQYFTAFQILRVSDPIEKERWVALNVPELDQNGLPIFDEVLDPETGEPMVNENGQAIIAPISESQSLEAFNHFDIKVDTAIYDNSNEQALEFSEKVLQGPSGQLLASVNPTAYLQISALAARALGLPHANQIADIMNTVAGELQNVRQQEQPEQAQTLIPGGAQ